jgi:transcriptional regulator with XRE-family HTH domain
MEHVGEIIRYHRGEAGMTQEDLAHRAGISPSSLIGIESGDTRRPRTGTLAKIARALELDSRELSAGKVLARI